MRQETLSCVCRVPQDELWDLLADYANVADLGSPGSSARLSTGRFGESGCTYTATVSWRGSSSTFTARLLEAVRPSDLYWEAQTAMGLSSMRIELKPLDSASTTVTVTSAYQTSESGRMFEAMTWGLLRTTLENTVQGLSRLDSASLG
jgi:hypothetical protein